MQKYLFLISLPLCAFNKKQGLVLKINGPAHEVWILFAFMQKPSLNAQTDISTRFRGLKLWNELSFTSILVYASREGLGESAHLYRLT